MSSPPRSGADVDSRLVPLINIVFLLLIFFMLAGSIRPPDPIEIDRPVSDAPGRPSPGPVRILLSPTGLFVDELAVEASELSAVLTARWSAQRAGDERAVEIHADRNLPFARLSNVLTVIRAATPDRVQLVTRGDG